MSVKPTATAMATVHAWCVEHRASAREMLEALVRLESPSTNTAAVERCAAELTKRLGELGASIERLPAVGGAPHIRASFDGDAPQVLVLGHIDTVWDIGQIERMPLHEADGRLFGPGVFDMKAGIAASTLAVRAIHELTLRRPAIVMLWTTDEEIGSGSSRAFIEAEARRSQAVLVLEPSLPGGAVKTSRKGCGDFELVVRGVPAHAGIDPGQGASAITELAHQIIAVQQLNDSERGISVNVGIVSGGTRTNVVAGEARASIDVRVPTMADAARIEASLQRLRPRLERTSVEVHGGIGRPPLERSEPVLGLYRTACEVARELGRDLPEGATGGGSDGNFTAAIGVPTLDGLGPQGDGAHALHEHILLEDLAWRAALLAGLLTQLAADPVK